MMTGKDIIEFIEKYGLEDIEVQEAEIVWDTKTELGESLEYETWYLRSRTDIEGNTNLVKKHWKDSFPTKDSDGIQILNEELE